MTEELEFLSLCSDTTFKYLYKTEKGRKWFNNIILKKTGIDLSGYELYDNELNRGNKKKDNRIDINLLNGQDVVIIEMENSSNQYSRRKNYQYLYRTLGNMYKEGEDYTDKKAKLIAFNNYKNKDLPDMMMGNFRLEDKINNLVIEDLESYEIYLPNFKNICYHNANKEDISLSLFTCKSYEEMKTKTNNKEDIEIIEELEELAMNGAIIFDYHDENEERLEKIAIRDEARNEGLQEGIDKRNVEIAKSLLSTNMRIEEISRHTGLSISEIDKLK